MRLDGSKKRTILSISQLSFIKTLPWAKSCHSVPTTLPKQQKGDSFDGDNTTLSPWFIVFNLIWLCPWQHSSFYHYLWLTIFGWNQVIFTIQKHQTPSSTVVFLIIKIIVKDWLWQYFHFDTSAFIVLSLKCLNYGFSFINKKVSTSLICSRQTELYETLMIWLKIGSLIKCH